LEQQPNDQPLRQPESTQREPRPAELGASELGQSELVQSELVQSERNADGGGAMLAGAAGELDGPPSDGWIDAQLSRLELLLRAPDEPAAVARFLLLELCPLVHALQGAAYVLEKGATQLSLAAGYAAGDGLPARVTVGEGLLGQCAASRRKLVASGVSSDYFRVRSALGASAPARIIVVPVALEAGALVVLELAFLAHAPGDEGLLDRLAQRRRQSEPLVAEPFDDGLVTPSSGLTAGAAPTGPLAPGRTSSPSGLTRQGIWSTLSHELRSPLNSVIVLSQVLAENVEQNLTAKQVNLARVIHGSGKDLLALVDTVALLAKVEARRLILSPGELELAALERHLWRALEPLARARALRLAIEVEPGAPRSIITDPARASQIVECMLVAAIERADGPVVRLRIGARRSGWSSDRERLNGAQLVLAFAVDGSSAADVVRPSSGAENAPPGLEPSRAAADGEPDAAAPALGVLARGGMLGLALGRKLAALLGGELQQDGTSSELTLYLPAASAEPIAAADGVRAGGARPLRAREQPGGVVEPEPGRPPIDLLLQAAELEGLQLLLVDTDVRRAFTLTGHLERHGASVAHAEELSEALDRLRGRMPSAVLIDARVLLTTPEPSVQRLLRLAEQTPCVVIGEEAADLPHLHRASRAGGAREVVTLLQRVADGARSPQTRAR
jgi:CheY-like chemotaxis protein